MVKVVTGDKYESGGQLLHALSTSHSDSCYIQRVRVNVVVVTSLAYESSRRLLQG